MLRLICLFLVVALCGGQNERVLLRPEPRHCADRDLHLKYGNHWYFFSWLNPQSALLAADWLDARNICRRHCMDLVSIETPDENNMLKRALAANNIPWIWTSGRLCDFDGCDKREDLQPVQINGWFWSGSGAKLPPTTDRVNNDWSFAGTGSQQPDNREVPESCLGMLNNIYNDSISWHDINCFHAKPFVCEDSDDLMSFTAGQGHTIRGFNIDQNPNGLTDPFQTYRNVLQNAELFRNAAGRK